MRSMPSVFLLRAPIRCFFIPIKVAGSIEFIYHVHSRARPRKRGAGARPPRSTWANIDCGVVAFAGCASPPVTVTITSSPDDKPVTSWHGPEGHYRIDALPPGTYPVEASTRGTCLSQRPTLVEDHLS